MDIPAKSDVDGRGGVDYGSENDGRYLGGPGDGDGEETDRNDQSLAWDELIVFTFVDGRKKLIQHFSGDQYGVDRLFG